jgi:hypothetical protein
MTQAPQSTGSPAACVESGSLGDPDAKSRSEPTANVVLSSRPPQPADLDALH